MKLNFVGNVKYIWTSGRKCNFNGCDRPDLQPHNVNGWFWSGSGAKIGPTSQRNSGDWSQTGGYGQPQPDNREAAQVCDPTKKHKPWISIRYKSNMDIFILSFYFFVFAHSQALQNYEIWTTFMANFILDQIKKWFVVQLQSKNTFQNEQSKNLKLYLRNFNFTLFINFCESLETNLWQFVFELFSIFVFQGNDESCLSILNNFYNDGIKWHDVACHHVKPFVCEDSDELLNFVASRNPGIRL